MTQTMQIDTNFVLGTLEDLSRFRPLTEPEVDILEKCVHTTMNKTKRHYWTPEEDRKLLAVAAKEANGISALARDMGLTPEQAWERLRRIRNQARKTDRAA